MPALKPGEDPRRVLRRHRERGPAHLFTFDELAEAAIESPATTRSRLRTTTDARTAALYITEALAKRSIQLTDVEAVQALAGAATPEEWQKRWPRFDLYRCGFPSCPAIILVPGLCEAHGTRPFAKVVGDHFVIWTGREYTEMCRVVFGVVDAGAVEHVDRNSWNCHPDNLIAPTDVRGRSSRRHRWSYGYRELANLFDVSEDGVRQAVSRGLFDPASLSSLVNFWRRRQKH